VDPIIPNMSDLINAVALAVILQPTKLNGQEVRFLRKLVGKNNKDFSRLLNVDNTHLSKVENGLNGMEIGDQLDKYVRVLVMNMSDSLRDKFVRLLERIPQIINSPVARQLIEIDISTLECEYTAE
jgi:transcriptional regulator with XRE-family HTH domain